ncbi:MAG: hypothetical protein ABR497_05400 [Kiritimatiellia bacterium]
MSALHFGFDHHDRHKRPYNWRVQHHSAHQHIHGAVCNAVLELYSAGARHIPFTPTLRDCKLELEFSGGREPAGEASLKIMFRYDCREMLGHCIEIAWKAGAVAYAYGRMRRRDFDVLERRGPVPVDGCTGRVDLMVADNMVTVSAGGQTARFSLAPDLPDAGAVALERGFSPGSMALAFVTIEPAPRLEKKVLARHAVVFPPDINGQNIPLRYDLTLSACGNVFEMEVGLSGGALEKPDLPWFPYHGRFIDFLDSPYIRTGRTQDGILYLANGRLVMGNVKGAHFYNGLYRRPSWPLRRVFRFDEPPEYIALGYEHYLSSVVRHLAGGPTEVVLDLRTGQVVYAGERVLRGDCALTLRSPADKAVCRRLPAGDPRRDRALAFAQGNHFFMEGEPVRFTAELREDWTETQAMALGLKYQLEDACLDPLAPAGKASLSDPVAGPAGTARMAVLDDFKKLPVGVYHLRLDARVGGDVIKTLRKAFEVMPAEQDAPPAPLASGLPVLYSSPTEVMGLDLDGFDPWNGRGVDAAHYLSIACFVPGCARENRVWQVLKVYGRKWYMWLTSRTTPDYTIAGNADLLAHCDYVTLAADEQSYHLYLWKWPLYTGILLEILNRFLAERRQPAIKEMTAPVFEDRVLPVWKDWIFYFCRWLRHERLPEQQRALEALNPRLRRSDYGPINAYTSTYKLGYNMLFRGLDARDGLGRYYNGFYLFEDYPFACGYPVHAKTCTLAAMKLEDPRIQYHPELYSPIVQGCPDSAVMYANPPYGNSHVTPERIRRRILEYVYATVWHDCSGFAYWQDHGFHVRTWPMELFESLLRTWGFVRRVRPVKPLRTTAFVCSREICLRHPDTYRRPAGPYPSGDLYNTAEECIPFVYDMARRAGLPAGFMAALDSLERLAADDTDLLVLPPLLDVPQNILDCIRALHGQGVNLLCFETVAGLEDLFGVVSLAAPVRVRHIRRAAGALDDTLPGEEYTEHEGCVVRYREAGADVLLAGDGGTPVLTCHRTPAGLAALWTVPPTVVCKDVFFECGGYGRESISDLVNGATRALLRRLARPQVSTTEGALSAFWDQAGRARIIVSENAFPAPASAIRPLVTIRLPGLQPGMVECDQSFDIVSATPESLALRLKLAPDECAVITVES